MICQRLQFLSLRLKRSSLPEVIHRLREQLFLVRFKKDPSLYQKDFSKLETNTIDVNSLVFPAVTGNIKKSTIIKLLQGKMSTLNQDNSEIKKFEEKNRNIFFSTVNQEASDPDIRAVWEPARLQHLMMLLHHLSSGCEKSQKTKVKEYVKSRLLEWITTNPFPYGPHYISVMECGLRIPLFISALQLLDNLSNKDRQIIIHTIYQHGWLIRKRLSLYSSLGNHTIAECVGLVFAGGLLQKDRQGREWLEIGISLLEQESQHQILDDGGPMEQSFSYHRFVLDLYWLSIQFLTENGFHDCTQMKKRVIRGETFLQTIQQADESLPMIGDSDDGYALGSGISPVRNIQPLLKRQKTFNTFPNSGYSVFRGDKGLRTIFDHGPLGMEPLNNHGHADGLSIFMSVQDVDFLIDPGTFQYNGDQNLRHYFKGTSAHNTICIDHHDQANQLTGFVWDRSYLVDWKHDITSEGYHRITASHNGYAQQRIPVIHTRTIVFNPSRDDVTIEDTFAGRGHYEYALYFHLHPSVKLSRQGQQIQLVRKKNRLTIDINTDIINILHGEQNPIAGWYSPAYGKKIATTTIQATAHGTPENISFKTRIQNSS